MNPSDTFGNGPLDQDQQDVEDLLRSTTLIPGAHERSRLIYACGVAAGSQDSLRRLRRFRSVVSCVVCLMAGVQIYTVRDRVQRQPVAQNLVATESDSRWSSEAAALNARSPGPFSGGREQRRESDATVLSAGSSVDFVIRQPSLQNTNLIAVGSSNNVTGSQPPYVLTAATRSFELFND